MPGNSCHRVTNLSGFGRSVARSGPKQFDGDLGARAREQVIDAMRNRLAYFRIDAGNASELLSHLFHALQRVDGRLLSVTTSISLVLTPAACSSSSARPVRRVVETTSGNFV